MDYYHIWCNLAAGASDLSFCTAVRDYLDPLRDQGLLQDYRITRCKLGLRPPALREFHVVMEFEDLEQLQRAFDQVAARREPIEGLHHAVNHLVRDPLFALYRDFPDPVRATGEERF